MRENVILPDGGTIRKSNLIRKENTLIDDLYVYIERELVKL